MSENFEAARATFVSGVQAFEGGDLPRAEALFLDSLRLLPGRPSTLVNLAAVRHRLGRPAEALAALDQALAAQPDDAPAWFHHGQLLQVLQRPHDALHSYERVLAIDGSHGAAWTQRGSLLKDMGQLEPAAHSFRQALAHGSDAELNRYFLASVEAGLGRAAGTVSDAPASAPRHYVEALFDSYAEDFDQHLLGKLGYRTPGLLVEMLCAQPPLAASGLQAGGAKRWRAALDLGCGTGLMGPLLAPHCAALDGVDLSARMLQKALALGCYRHLVHGDVADHLHSTGERHDLIVAADVFVYIGDLDRVFAGVRRVLGAHGMFAFSVEEAPPEAGQFVLRASSRFAHSEPYVVALATAHGMRVSKLERTTLRHDQKQPIGGLLVTLQPA